MSVFCLWWMRSDSGWSRLTPYLTIYNCLYMRSWGIHARIWMILRLLSGQSIFTNLSKEKTSSTTLSTRRQRRGRDKHPSSTVARKTNFRCWRGVNSYRNLTLSRKSSRIVVTINLLMSWLGGQHKSLMCKIKMRLVKCQVMWKHHIMTRGSKKSNSFWDLMSKWKSQHPSRVILQKKIVLLGKNYSSKKCSGDSSPNALVEVHSH